MSPQNRRTLWVVAAVVVVIALVGHHNISTNQIILFLVVIPSIILHEVSHGWVARLFGDRTAAIAGRLTLNPLKHVDPVGTLIVPALLVLGGFGGIFGWAKPVPVNTSRLRSPRNNGVAVALAGPAMNLVLAALGALVFIVAFKNQLLATGNLSVGCRAVLYFGVANVGLAAFNLMPIPPLDGSVLLERALPSRHWPTYLRIRQYTMPIIFGLVLLNLYLHPGPITWLMVHLYNWWLSLVGAPIRFGF